MYRKLAGMTGTAAAEVGELSDVYNLEVLPIPTHRPVIRLDEPAKLFITRSEKHEHCFELLM